MSSLGYGSPLSFRPHRRRPWNDIQGIVDEHGDEEKQIRGPRAAESRHHRGGGIRWPTRKASTR